MGNIVKLELLFMQVMESIEAVSLEKGRRRGGQNKIDLIGPGELNYFIPHNFLQLKL